MTNTEGKNPELKERVDALENEMNEIEEHLDPVNITGAIMAFADYREIDPVEAMDRIITCIEENRNPLHFLDSDARFILDLIEISQSAFLASLTGIRRSIAIQVELDNTEF